MEGNDPSFFDAGKKKMFLFSQQVFHTEEQQS